MDACEWVQQARRKPVVRHSAVLNGCGRSDCRQAVDSDGSQILRDGEHVGISRCFRKAQVSVSEIFGYGNRIVLLAGRDV